MSDLAPAAFAASTEAAAPAAPAPAPAPAAEPTLKVGSLVTVADGRVAVVVAIGDAPREVPQADGTSQLQNLPGYRIAFFAGAIDSPHTAKELGLQAL